MVILCILATTERIYIDYFEVQFSINLGNLAAWSGEAYDCDRPGTMAIAEFQVEAK